MGKHGDSVPTTQALKNLASLVGEGTKNAGRRAAVVTATSGLALTGAVAANASPATTNDIKAETKASSTASLTRNVTATPSVDVAFDSRTVSAKSVKLASKPQLAQAPAPQAEVKPANPQKAASAETVSKEKSVAPQQAAKGASQASGSAVARAPVANSGIGAKIASAAYAQLGVRQDCTALVTNALKSVGINFHDWPAGYQKLGRVISAAEAQPGDLVYYSNNGMGGQHIAVYVGNGKAVHGGWLGNNTVVDSVVLPVGGPTSYIAMGH